MTPTPGTRELILGVLGRAQRHYGVEIHYFVFMSNHYHLLLSVESALQLSRFMGYLNSNVAREVGRSIGWRDRFWSRRYQAIPVSSEEAAQLSRLHYGLAHGVKEGLVERPSDWPGAHGLGALLDGETPIGTWFDRTLEYEACRSGRPREFGSAESVRLSPLPCWRHLEEWERRRNAREMVTAIEEEAAAERCQTGKVPPGPAALAAAAPEARPVASKRGPAPWVHAATRAVRELFQVAYREFEAHYREASLKLRSGDRAAVFPAGSFPPSLPWEPEFA